MLYFKSQIHLNYLDSKDMGQLKITGKHTHKHTHLPQNVRLSSSDNYFN